MIVGIIGSGGREHAICSSIYKSEKVRQIYCLPGNAGTESIATNVKLKLDNFEELASFVRDKKINFLIVGPEQPLVNGIVDFFKKEGVKIFGPNRMASQLEGSKIFTKKLCEKYNIPTAKFEICKNIHDANKFISNANFPIVVKADGLAAGKGVYICEKKDAANIAIKEIFEGKFGDAKDILFEEFLVGEEMSYFIISDGKIFKSFQTAQDHKRVMEGDRGNNTGGMGAYSPSRLINNDLEKKIIKKIIEPTLLGLKKLDCDYTGFLYVGLMIVNNEPYLIEYNVRMGDPECQTILPKLKTDLMDILINCEKGNLNDIDIEWRDEKSLCVVLCSNGYPGIYQNEVLIEDIDKIKLEKNNFIFHAGTKIKEGKIYSNGGRVLNFVALSNNFKESRDRVIKVINRLNWQGGFFRKDIGHKVID